MEHVHYLHRTHQALALKRIGEKVSGGGSGGSGRAKGGNGGNGNSGGGDGGFYTGTDVVTLTDSNFQEEVAGSEELWFVEVSLRERV